MHDMKAHDHGHSAQARDVSPAADPPGGHGMAMLGTNAVYMSHLPMFMSPHDYQVILEVTFTGQGADPNLAYASDRANHPKDTLYTFEPKAFVLPDLFLPTPIVQPR